MLGASVLIATRDRPADLGRCLQAVCANDYPAFDVIVVDQSTTPAAERVVRSLGDPRVLYLRQHARGLSIARNAAIGVARGAICAFTDDDCTPDTSWVSRLVKVFAREPEVGVVFGSLCAAAHDPERVFIPRYVPARYRRRSGVTAVSHFGSHAGGNMAIARHVFRTVGTFDPCLGAGARFKSGEDSDMQDRVLRAGFTVIDDPHSLVVHWGARSRCDGVMRQLTLNTTIGWGALLAKEVRCGSMVAAASTARFVTRRAAAAGWANVRRCDVPQADGATQTELLQAFSRGFLAGCLQPLDRRANTFRELTGADGEPTWRWARRVLRTVAA